MNLQKFLREEVLTLRARVEVLEKKLSERVPVFESAVKTTPEAVTATVCGSDKEVNKMKITVEGDSKEIAALVLALRERQAEDISAEFAAKLHQEIRNQLEAVQGGQESQ